MIDHALAPHPGDAPQPAVRAIVAGAEFDRSNVLRLEYRLAGDLAGVAIPRRALSRRADRLWENTCFEAFIIAGDGPRYYELNFAPSTEWAAYEFDGYRQGMRPLTALEPPLIAVAEAAHELHVTASVAIGALAAAPWPRRVGLTAVVADRGGRRGYYALRHPRDKPDFHDAASFTVLLGGSAR